MSKNPKTMFQNLRSDYPEDLGLNGYKPYISFLFLAVLTYIVTFNQYSPEVIGSVLYFVPIITGLTYYVFEDSINKHSINILRYLMFILIATFILYFVYLSIVQFTSALQEVILGGSLSIIKPVISLAEVLVGIPVTATFYHSIYVYYQLLCKLSDEASDSNEDD